MVNDDEEHQNYEEEKYDRLGFISIDSQSDFQDQNNTSRKSNKTENFREAEIIETRLLEAKESDENTEEVIKVDKRPVRLNQN